MYISKLSIQGYKNTQQKSTISFNRGLNVLLGENGCGKTAIINALRLLFREPESNYACSPDDFYCSLDRSYTRACFKTIKVTKPKYRQGKQRHENRKLSFHTG